MTLFDEAQVQRRQPDGIKPPRLAAYLTYLETSLWRLAHALQVRTDTGREILERHQERLDLARDTLIDHEQRIDQGATVITNIQTWRTGTVNPALQSHQAAIDDLIARVEALEAP